MKTLFRACLVLVTLVITSTSASAQGAVTFRLLDQFGEPVGSSQQAVASYCLHDAQGLCWAAGWTDAISPLGVGWIDFATSGSYTIEFTTPCLSINRNESTPPCYGVNRRQFTIGAGALANLGDIVVPRQKYNYWFTDQNPDITARVIPQQGGRFETPFVIDRLSADGGSSTVKILMTLQVPGTNQSWTVYEDWWYHSTLTAPLSTRWVSVWVPAEIPNGFAFCVIVRLVDESGRIGQYPEVAICGVKGI